MPEVLSGLRHGVRAFRRAPGFAALAVVILASGIGASTVMYTLVESVLLRELPFEDPSRLVWMYNTRTERDRAPLSLPDLEDYRRAASSLAGLAVFTNWTTNLTGAGSPERLDGVRVSGNFFELLGTRPALGRLLEPEDEAQERRVTVMTHGLWQRRFGGDRNLIGRNVILNGAGYTVVGVLQPRFLFPFRDAELAVPVTLQSDPRRSDRGANFLRVVARLAPAVTLARARADLDAIAHRLRRQYPDENARKIGISLYPLHPEMVRDYRGMLWALFASVGVLLLVGCVNLANLLLVRAAGRQMEFAVRTSLGASAGQLARQLLGETAVLAAAGGGLGLFLAYVGLAAWRTFGPADFPRLSTIHIDIRALVFAIAVSIITALACGLAPAWFVSRRAIAAGSMSQRTATTSRSQWIVQRVFVSGQVAAATVLLIGMMLMARGLDRLERVSPGFTPGRAVTLQLSLPPRAYGTRQALTRFFESVRDRLAAIPEVEAAGAVSLLPLSGLLSTADVAFPDRPAPPPEEVPQAHLRVTTPEYFSAAGIRLLDGRAFDLHDTQNGQPVAIVSRTFAERHWPGTRAVGRAVQIIQSPQSPELTVVGVVSDVKQFTLDGQATADLYVPLHQMPAFQAPLIASRLFWVVRGTGTGDEQSLTRAVRAAVTGVEPDVAAGSSRTLEALWLASLGSRRANVHLLAAFGNIALGLCAIGVYAVTAFAARMRRRELAIRFALGASRRALTRSMLGRELQPVLVGLGLGVVAALMAAPLLFDGAFEISPRDVRTYSQVVVILLGVALLATYIPVHRAGAGVANPSEVLTP
jgi:putative ABC transport system permease protein